MSSPFKRIAPVDQIDAIFMTDEDVGEQLEAEDPELRAFKARQRASPCYKKVVRSRRDHSAAGRVMNLVEKFKKSGDFVEQKKEEDDSDDEIMSLAEIREKMKNAKSPTKTVQKSITEASKPAAKADVEGHEPITPVKEVDKPVEALVAAPKADATESKPDAESVEEASDKENTSAAANKGIEIETKPVLKDSPTKPKPVSSPTKIGASSNDRKQPTLLSFFKQPTSTSPLKRKREEDGVDDEGQGKAKQLKTTA